MAQTADKLTVGIPHWPFPNRRFHTKQQLDYIILSDDERKRTSIFSFCNNADKLERISKRQLFRFSVRNPLRKFYRFSLNFFRSRYNRDLHVFCLQYYRSASCQFVLICISRYRSTDHFSCCTIGTNVVSQFQWLFFLPAENVKENLKDFRTEIRFYESRLLADICLTRIRNSKPGSRVECIRAQICSRFVSPAGAFVWKNVG